MTRVPVKRNCLCIQQQVRQDRRRRPDRFRSTRTGLMETMTLTDCTRATIRRPIITFLSNNTLTPIPFDSNFYANAARDIKQ